MAVNKFTDMSDDERRMYLGSTVTRVGSESTVDKAWFGAERLASDLPPVDMATLPASVDWRNVQPSIITPPKDQVITTLSGSSAAVHRPASAHGTVLCCSVLVLWCAVVCCAVR